MSNCAIVGINWGDEGKGRMVDLLTADYDVVVRYQGGGNAGHTVVNELGKFALHLLPSGIFHPAIVNILGNGVALDPENLWLELETVRARGVSVGPENLKISDRASLLLPWHRELDALEEARLKDRKYGSTKQGIAPFYSDKYQKKTVLAGELRCPEQLRAHMAELLEWKNLILTGAYGAEPMTMEALDRWIEAYGNKLLPFLCDTGGWLREAQAAGKRILFDASWAPCGTWITASTPTPPPPTPSLPTPPSAPACPRRGSTGWWAWSRPIPPAWARAPSPASGSGKRRSVCVKPAANTAPRPGGPVGWARWTWWRPATGPWSRGPRSWP